MVDHAVELRAVHKAYRPGLFRKTVTALRGLDITVGTGETYALIGPNGAGKTTTFRILLGLIRPDSGDGMIFGLPLGSDEARRRLGYLPEVPAYYPYLTVAETLRLAGRLSGVPAVGTAVERALERFDLVPLAGRPLRRLSKGQLQRIGLAQAALHDPDLLILDEPMSGLDPLNRADVKDWIRSLRSEGKTVVLASHVLADVEALADRVGILAGGRVVMTGETEELLRGSEEEIDLEFEIAGRPQKVLEGLATEVEDRSGVWGARFPAGDELQVRALVTRVLASGGSIRHLRRERRSLETAYVDWLTQRGALTDATKERRA
jgi:ABC-2 type transport system ATP-binding protein